MQNSLGENELIIVTGGAGFIGSNLVRALNDRGFTNILIVDHLTSKHQKKYLKKLQFSKYLEKDAFRRELQKGAFSSVSTMFHLGACSNTKEYDTSYLLDNNLEYSKEIFTHCLLNNIKLIYASSASVYGDGSKGYSEYLTDLAPLNPYALSKYAFDEWVKLQPTKPKQCIGLRFFNVYGPNEDHKKEMASVIFHAYSQIQDYGSIKLFKSYNKQYRDGEQKRDFIYVKDVINVLLYFMDHQLLQGIYNVGTGKARSFNDLASCIFKALNLQSKIVYIPMPEELKKKYQYYTQADITLLRKVGYSVNFTSLEDGVEDYIKNYLQVKR